MSQRSHSFLKRFKTQRSDNPITSNRQILNKTPISRKQSDTQKPKTPLKTKSNYPKIQMKHADDYNVNCINHPSKKALFESNDNLSDAFCYQCAIRLVKMNVRLVKLSEKNMFLREFLQKEMKLIHEYEKHIHELISSNFQYIRQKYLNAYNLAKFQEKLDIQLPNFKIPESRNLQQEVKKIVGEISLKKVQLVEKVAKIPEKTSFSDPFKNRTKMFRKKDEWKENEKINPLFRANPSNQLKIPDFSTN